MASSSTSPPPPGGNTKYVIIGLLLAVAAGVLWFAMRPSELPTEPVAQAPDASVQRSTALAPEELELPDPVEDAGTDAGEGDAGTVRRPRGTGVPRETWECTGEIAAGAAREVVAQNRAQVRSCYERRLKVVNTLQGTLQLELRIGQDGKVTGVRRSGGTLHDSETFSCVRQLAENWRFPPPSGGRCAVMVAPFNLTPRP